MPKQDVPAVKETPKLNVNDRTSLVVFTGGIDSTYLLLDLKRKYKEVGASLSDLVPVWFEGNNDQVQAIRDICRELELTPLILPADKSMYSPRDYLPPLIKYCLDNKIVNLFTALNNDEALSDIPDLDYDLGYRLETEIKDAKRKDLMSREDTTEADIKQLNKFNVNYPILGLNKHIIIKRLQENFDQFGLKKPFDLSKTFRTIGEDVVLDKEKNITVNSMLEKMRKTGFGKTRHKDPLLKNGKKN